MEPMDISWTFSDNGASDGPPFAAITVRRSCGDHSVEARTGAWCRFVPGQRNYPHRHAGFFEFSLVARGRGTFEHAGQRQKIGPGSLFVADPDVAHEIRQTGTDPLDLIYWMVRIRSDGPAPLPSWEQSAVLAFLAGRRRINPDCNHLLPLLAGLRGDDPRMRWCNEQIFWAVVGTALMAASSEPVPSVPMGGDDAVRVALDHIERNCHRDLSVAQVAAAAGISERQLRRCFLAVLGRPPVQVMAERRMNRAAQRLLLGASVSQAAAAIGVVDTPQFTRQFRARYGCTPAVFRRRHQVDDPPPLTWHGAAVEGEDRPRYPSRSR
jgi:AraC-like DNA-binding protein/mannose-6-phosphate isomerase-like protein (cupin superfamily)